MFVSYVLTPYIKKLAFKIGAVDKPDMRKVHKRIMPRLGGLAIYIAFVIACLASMELTMDLVGILIGGTMITVLGVLDDVYQLPAKVKLLGQIAAACVLVLFDIRIEWVNNPLGGFFYLDMLSIPFTILWVISFTNVVNLIDGLDGLAAGVSAIASLTVILVAIQMGYFHVALLTAALAGAIIGFIRYNFNPATIFMGDTGSMFLGYMLAAISIYGAVKTATTIALIVPAIALGLPILDTAFAIMRRYVNGKPIFQPDKGHLHHRLLDTGMSHKEVVLFMYGITAILCIGAVLWAEMDGFYAALIIAVIITAVAVGAKKIGILNDNSREEEP
jgi:UDP-GlcNAc:undecaprenyl-phosphate GlcNAc-1-phosphate transferase